MARIDARLPQRIAAGLRIGPEWMTNITQMVNGHERRNAQWAYPRWRASANMGAFSVADREAFRAMFVVARGRWGEFRVNDPLDCTANNAPLSPAIGTSTPVQLTRRYTFPGGVDFIDVPVRAPVAGTVTVTRDGSPVAGTLDTLTGLFTPDANWSAGSHAWTGQFDRWMRFDSDWGALTANALNAYTADVELVEVR